MNYCPECKIKLQKNFCYKCRRYLWRRGLIEHSVHITTIFKMLHEQAEFDVSASDIIGNLVDLHDMDTIDKKAKRGCNFVNRWSQ